VALTVQQEDLASLHGDWCGLLDRVSDPVPFMHPTWQRVWLEEFADGREPLYLTARDGSSLVGVAPLLRDGDGLSFVGHYSICDYMDFVVPQDGASDVFAALFAALARESWSVLELRGLRDSSPALAELPALAEANGFAAEREDEAVAPRIILAPSWDDYVSSLGKKDRHELRRKIRRVQAAGELELRAHTSPEAVEEHLPVLLRMMVESRADKANFMSEQMGRFFHRMALAMAGEGLVRLYELELDSKPVASVLCFDQGGQFYLYNSGYEPDASGLAVGIVSKALCLMEAIGEGKHCFDFLRGHESYKYDLGGQDQQIYKLAIRRA
jgi:CelD/BcsL family acetyltransferase involved in cellulose biosynthesis